MTDTDLTTDNDQRTENTHMTYSLYSSLASFLGLQPRSSSHALAMVGGVVDSGGVEISPSRESSSGI